jgi:hypothetical protein
MDNETQQTAAQSVPKIHAAIMAVMAEIGAIEKTKKNEQQNFMFRGIGDAMSACQPLFVKHGLYLRPLTVRIDDTKENLDRDGKPRGTHSRQIIVYRATCAADASYVDSEATGEAIDFADKCAGKVASISFKTLIFQMFCIPDHNPESDPDGQSPGVGDGDKGKSAAQAKDKPKGETKPADSTGDKKPSPLKMLIAKLAQADKVDAKDVLGWMTAQLKREVKATKDLKAADIEQLTKTVDEILKETK